MPMIRTSASCLAVLLVSATLAADAAPTAMARYDDWSVFTETVNGETICYAATEATDKAPKAGDHGDVWFFVMNSNTGQATAQPSLKVGYELRADLPARASIGRAGWTLYGVGNSAFAQDRDDPRLVSALRRGSELRVEAVSALNARMSYHFSLSGSADAIDRASALCR